MEEIVIGKIYRNSERKDGTKYVDKNGKPFKVVTIMHTNKVGQEERLSYCDYKGITDTWNEGERVQVKIEKNGDYLNFSPPNKNDEILDKLTKRIEALERAVNVPKTQENANIEATDYGYKDDLPFS